MKRKHRHAPYPTSSLPDDSHRRFPPPEAQPHIHQSILIDERRAAQERQIETLFQDNQRLAAAHVALKQDLAIVQQDLQRLSSTAATLKAERDAEVREVYEKALKMEVDVRSVGECSVEIVRVRTDIQNFDADREELTTKLKESEDELVKVRSELQQFPVIKAQLETMHQEVARGRAAIDYEKRVRASNLEYSKTMEKHKITFTDEIEKLQAELANTEKRARAAAAAAAPSNSNHQFAAANPNFGYSTNYGIPETGYGGSSYPAPYAVHQVQGVADANTQYGQGAMSYTSHVPYDMKQPYVHQ